MRPDSRPVHAGRHPRSGEPLAPPLVQAAVYVYDSLDAYDEVASGRAPGHVYARNSNENVGMLETAVAELEGAGAAVATGSGMAAILVTLLALAPKPVPIVAAPDLYGVTWSLLTEDFETRGYELRVVPMSDFERLAEALKGAGLLICETVSNPLCAVSDLPAICRLAAAAGVPVVVDNTFATPILCRPLEAGATATVHSVTKFLGGHSDLIAGVVAGDRELMRQVRVRAVRMGTTLGPFEAWLALRGMRTLALRVRRQSASALSLAEGLASLPDVEAVHYPLLEGSPWEQLARRVLAEGAGGMLAFDLAGGRSAVQAMLQRLRMVTFAASLGGVETTISHPEITSHRALTPEQRLQLGIKPGTVRVSVGLEDPADVLEDFAQAIDGR